MFEGCTALEKAPEINATTIEGWSCNNMFKNCTGLKYAPSVLPALHVQTAGYQWMFLNCTSLETVPVIDAITCENSAFYEMFNGCSSITETPIFKINNISSNDCFDKTFINCTNLSKISVGFNQWGTTNTNGTITDNTNSWVSGVNSTGKFVCTKTLNTSLIDESHIPSGWEIETTFNELKPLEFTNINDREIYICLSRFEVISRKRKTN